MADERDILLGRLAVDRGFATKAQVDECLAAGEGKPLGQILLERGHITFEQLDDLLHRHRLRQSQARSRPGGLFGQILLAKRFVTVDQLNEAVREQRRLAQAGEKLPLGQILIKMHALQVPQFLEALKLQEKSLLKCDGCGAKFNVVGYDEGTKIRCKKCRRILTVPGAISEVTAVETIDPARDTPLPSVVDTRILTTQPFGKYRLERLIGRGGMGLVFRARDTELDRAVAVKILREGEGADAASLQRFHLEAQTSARLRHPNIVPIHDVGTEHGMPYFVMDLIEGETLDVLLAKKRLTPAQAVGTVETVARAVAAAHRERIIHRDLKPGNVIVDAAGKPYVMDFGLARAVDRASALTRAGAAVGTPFYMSPEAVRGDSTAIGERSDVYSLGVMLYEATTRRLPFVGRTTLDVYNKITDDEPIAPRKIQPAIPADLETICLKAMEKEAARRYESAEAFADDLARHRRGEFILARPPGAGERMARWFRRRRALTASLVVAAVLTIGFAVYLIVQQRAAEDELQTWMVEARVAMDAGRADDAEKALNRVAGRDPLRPGLAALQRRLDAVRRLQRGTELLDEGHWDAALKELKVAAARGAPDAELLRRALGTGTLSVRGPRDDEPVLLDGAGIGTTPLEDADVPLGVHALRVGDVDVPIEVVRAGDGRGSEIAVDVPAGIPDGWAWAPGGEFVAGVARERVHVPPFLIRRDEVTRAEFDRFLKSIDDPGRRAIHTPPDGRVPFESARLYTFWLGARLPSAREWEKAARGIDGRLYPWGNDMNGPDASPYGVRGLAGGAAEWTSGGVLRGGFDGAVLLKDGDVYRRADYAGSYPPDAEAGLRPAISLTGTDDVEALAQLLKTGAPGMRHAALRRLIEIGAADEERLRAAAGDPDDAIAFEAIRALPPHRRPTDARALFVGAWLGDAAALARLIREADEEVEARYLVWLGAPEALLALTLAYLGTGDAEAEKRILADTERLRKAVDCAPAYEKMLAHDEPGVRLNAVAWIGEAENVQFNAALARMAKKDTSTRVREHALLTLAYLEPDPVTFWTLLIEAEPGDPMDYNMRGWEHFKAGRLDAALADFDEGLRHERAKPQPNGTMIARLSYELGAVLARRGDHAGAIEAFTAAIEGWPELACPYGGRGLSRLASGDREGAAADLESCLKIGLDREMCEYDPQMTEEALRRALERAQQ